MRRVILLALAAALAGCGRGGSRSVQPAATGPRHPLVQRVHAREANIRAHELAKLAATAGRAEAILLCEALGSAQDTKVRTRAALALGFIGDPHAAEALTKALEDPWPPVRRSAIGALRRLWEAKMGNAPMSRLCDGDRNTEKEAVAAYQTLKDPEAVIVLIGMVADRSVGRRARDDVTREVIKSLGHQGDARAIGVLAALLDSPRLGPYAAQAIGRIVGEDFRGASGRRARELPATVIGDPAKEKAWLAERPELVDGEPARTLMASLKAIDDGVARLAGVNALDPPALPGLVAHGKLAVGALLRAYRDGPLTVRPEAAFALACMKDPDLTGFLARVAASGESDLALIGHWGLAYLGRKELTPYAGLKVRRLDPPSVRRAALALGKTHHPIFVRPLCDALSNRKGVEPEVIRALVELGDARAAGPLIEAGAHHPEASWAPEAVEAGKTLKRLRSRPAR